MNLSLTDVRYFSEVAARSNVTKAAKVLGITQPSLSGAIRRLEAELGTPLLLRSKSGVQLTKAGILFQARAKELMGIWEDLRKATRERNLEITAKYTLGCHSGLALYILPSILPGLMKTFPSLETELIHGASREITEGVIDFRMDFGIVADPRPHPDLVVRRLGTDDVCFVIGGDERVPGTGKELEKLILVCDPGIYQTQVLLKELSRKKIQFRRHLYTPRLEIAAALVDAGMGVGILPLRVAKRLKTRPLVPLPQLPRMKNTICLIYRSETQGSPASRKIARFIEERGKWR